MIETFNTNIKNSGDRITASSVNIIQNGLDQIRSIWGLPNQGSKLAVIGEPCKADLVNTWITWLKFYSGRIGATHLTNGIASVRIGEPMVYRKIKEIYDTTQAVKNYCNRSECNYNECSQTESNGGECNGGECW